MGCTWAVGVAAVRALEAEEALEFREIQACTDSRATILRHLLLQILLGQDVVDIARISKGKRAFQCWKRADSPSACGEEGDTNGNHYWCMFDSP